MQCGITNPSVSTIATSALLGQLSIQARHPVQVEGDASVGRIELILSGFRMHMTSTVFTVSLCFAWIIQGQGVREVLAIRSTVDWRMLYAWPYC